MSVIDRFLSIMKLNPDDEDEYDDYEYDDEYEETPSRFGLHKSSSDIIEETTSIRERPQKSSSSKILPMRGGKQRQVSNDMEVCIIKPNTVEDAREITETLLNDRTVVLNMEGVNLDVAQRIIDFTSGSCFAIDGNLQKISNYIFIITPPNVEISGDIQEFLGSFDNSPIQTDL